MLVRELPDSGGEPFAQSCRIARAALVPFASARWRRVGGDWSGDRLLRNGFELCEIARTIRPTDCRIPTCAGKTRLDGARDHKSAVARVASHPNDGSRQRATAANLIGEKQQCLDGAPMCPQSA